MTQKSYSIFFILLFAVWITTLFSCKKDKKNDEITPTVVETSDTEDNNLAEEESESVDDLIEHESNSNKEINGRYSNLVKDTVFFKTGTTLSEYTNTEYSNIDTVFVERKSTADSSSVAYRKVTFSFAENKLGGRRYRKGKIEFKFIGSNTMKMEGCSLVVKPINYSIKLKDHTDWIKIEGEKTISVGKINPLPFKKIVTVEVKNAKLYFKNDTFITWQSNRTKVISWEGTVRTVLLWGTASGTTRNGVIYSVKIDTLERKSSCEWRFLSGKLTFKRADKTDRILDFGSDNSGNVAKKECDPWVKVSVGTNSKVVSIK